MICHAAGVKFSITEGHIKSRQDQYFLPNFLQSCHGPDGPRLMLDLREKQAIAPGVRQRSIGCTIIPPSPDLPDNAGLMHPCDLKRGVCNQGEAVAPWRRTVGQAHLGLVQPLLSSAAAHLPMPSSPVRPCSPGHCCLWLSSPAIASGHHTLTLVKFIQSPAQRESSLAAELYSRASNCSRPPCIILGPRAKICRLDVAKICPRA